MANQGQINKNYIKWLENQTHSDEDGFVEQVWRSLKEVQEESLSKIDI